MKSDFEVFEAFTKLMLDWGPASPRVSEELEKYRKDPELHSLLETCRNICKEINWKWGRETPKKKPWGQNFLLGLSNLTLCSLAISLFYQEPSEVLFVNACRTLFASLFGGASVWFFWKAILSFFGRETP